MCGAPHTHRLKQCGIQAALEDQFAYANCICKLVLRPGATAVKIMGAGADDAGEKKRDVTAGIRMNAWKTKAFTPGDFEVPGSFHRSGFRAKG
ncbi:hypothetical protein BXY39_0068 [Eilatimonas milleporae]|uniref:Uncharacterized protein n=1 Tax=Eilatimonas milleporae TaxID=911205 RepID=A0A3M0CVF3_9PROT|nr:hypothetical protein BXY39_0068 [Eilatimonas milleporae]